MKICGFQFKPKDTGLACERIKWAVKDLDPDKVLDIIIETHKEKRSLDANAYLWVLINKISAELSKDGTPVSPNEVYRKLITEVPDADGVGQNFEFIPVRNDALKKWIENWEHKPQTKTGWVCKVLGPCRKPGFENYTTVQCFYGSSTYDTAQMSRLIDLAVQDARVLHIETKTPKELALLMEEWHG